LMAARLYPAGPVMLAVRYYETVCSHVMAALMVARYYLMSSTLSLKDDRDGQIGPALPIRAHYVASRDAPVDALNESHAVYDPARSLMVTRRVKVDQRCGPASSDRRLRARVHYSSSPPSSLLFSLPSLHASPEVLSVQPDENRAHPPGDRVAESGPPCYEAAMCR
jgi:hypothetical protein